MIKLQPILSPFAYLIYFFTPHSRLRFTREGFWFVFITLAVGVAALNTGIGLLYLMVSMMLSFIIVSGILSELSLMMLSVERVVATEIYAGRGFYVTFYLRNNKRFFPSFSLNIIDGSSAWRGGIRPEGYILNVPPGQRAMVRSRGMLPRRGMHQLARVALRTEYPFGLFVKEADYHCKQEVLVYPALGKVLDSSLLEIEEGSCALYRRDLAAQEWDEFHALRDYRAGDNPRWIHWRSSARMHKLMLKEFEIPRGKEAIIYFDSAASSPDGEKAIDLTASFAATLLTELHARGFTVSLVTVFPELRRQSSYPGEDGLTPLLRTLALAGPTQKGLWEITRGRQKLEAESGLKVLVSAGGDEEGLSQASADGFRVVCVTNPSFSALFSLPVMEGSVR